MKTYEEMAQSVISRAKAHKTVRNRWIAGSVAAVLALGVCVGVLGNRPQPDTTIQEQPVTQATQTAKVEEPRVTFLYAQGDTVAELQQGVTLPSHCELRVVDITGMTDEEIEAIALAEQEYADALVNEYGGDSPESKVYGWQQYNPLPWTSDNNDHLVVTFTHVGKIVFKIQDPSLVESIRATTKNGALILPAFPRAEEEEELDPFAYPQNRHYCMEGDRLQQWYYTPYDGFEVDIGLGSGLNKYLNDNAVALSELSETFTFTVTFTDGTVETHVIDMIFNDNGQIYTLYRGTEAAV